MPRQRRRLPPKRRFAVGIAERAAELACRARRGRRSRSGRPSRRAASAKSPAAQRGADARAGDAFAVQQHRLDRVGDEAEFARRVDCSSATIARAALAEAEVRADPDFARAEPLHQHVAHEVLGAASRPAAHRSAAGRRRRRPRSRRPSNFAARQQSGAAADRPARRTRAAAARSSAPPPARQVSRARATAWRTSARWPRCRPSKAPMQTTLPWGHKGPPSTSRNSLLMEPGSIAASARVINVPAGRARRKPSASMATRVDRAAAAHQQRRARRSACASRPCGEIGRPVQARQHRARSSPRRPRPSRTRNTPQPGLRWYTPACRSQRQSSARLR